MADSDPIETAHTVIKCDGGGRIVGHPLIYLNLEPQGKVVCPYCSQEFVNPSLLSSPLT